jgi:putative ABC transport system ATP-binding protein
MSAIWACGLDKSFGPSGSRIQVLKGVGLEVPRGEVVFLVGPSGGGKTTLLSILGCLLTPDRGAVRVLGQEISRLRPRELTAFRARHLAFVFQTFNLFPTLSALDNVCLSLTMCGVSLAEARRRAAAGLDQVGLGQRSHLRPAQLSTGECQRAAIARALASEPELLFADEPTASLDSENGQIIMRLLTQLTVGRGGTLVVVTHDDRILGYADRIVRLEDGIVTALPPPPVRSPPEVRVSPTLPVEVVER